MINIITVVCKTSKYRYLILEIKIKEIVDRDTDAWNNKDTEKLLVSSNQTWYGPGQEHLILMIELIGFLKLEGLIIKDGKKYPMSFLNLTF